MLCRVKLQYSVLFVILVARLSIALKYLFVPEYQNIFEDCQAAASNVLNIEGLFDMSELTLTSNDDTVLISGNLTYIWNIQPGDRVELRINIYRFDRIKWVQTPFGLTVPNMCSVMYKESDYWYQYWTRFVTNKEDVKNECFYPGTKLIYEPFNLSVTMDFTGIPLNGRYNVIATIKAFSLKNVERDTSICFGIEGEFNRL